MLLIKTRWLDSLFCVVFLARNYYFIKKAFLKIYHLSRILVNMSVVRMRCKLFRFKYARNEEDLKKCEFTWGLAFIMKFLRGGLPMQTVADRHIAIFYVARMEELLGLTLPPEDHPAQRHEGCTIEGDGFYQQQALIDSVLKKLDARPFR